MAIKYTKNDLMMIRESPLICVDPIKHIVDVVNNTVIDKAISKAVHTKIQSGLYVAPPIKRRHGYVNLKQ